MQRERETQDWRPVFIRLRSDERAAVEKLAAEEGRSLSSQARMMLRRQLEREERRAAAPPAP